MKKITLEVDFTEESKEIIKTLNDICQYNNSLSHRCDNCLHREISFLQEPCRKCLTGGDLYSLWERKEEQQKREDTKMKKIFFEVDFLDESKKVIKNLNTENKIQIAKPEGRFYYVRNHNNHPVVTVYIEKLDSMFWVRGTAICSKKDPIDKETGRVIAYANAMKKVYRRKVRITEEEQKKMFQRNIDSPVLMETMNHYFPSFDDLFADDDDDNEYIKFRSYNFLELITYKSKFITEKGLSSYERKLYGMGE